MKHAKESREHHRLLNEAWQLFNPIARMHKKLLTWLTGNDVSKNMPASLYDIAFRGDLKTLKLLTEGWGLKSQINRHLNWSETVLPCTPLLFAVIGGHDECVKFLIQQGADVGYLNDGGECALHFAISENNLNCVQILLKGGANLNGRAGSKCSPLVFASQSGNVEIIKELIRCGGDVNYADHLSPKPFENSFTKTPLFMSALHNKPDCFKFLLQSGANPNFNCMEQRKCQRMNFFIGGESMPHSASNMLDAVVNMNCSEDYAKLLVEFGADLSLFSYNRTPGESQTFSKNPCALFFERSKKNPRLLQNACRLRIRRCLGVSRLHSIHHLPLPTFLKNYLLYMST